MQLFGVIQANLIFSLPMIQNVGKDICEIILTHISITKKIFFFKLTYPGLLGPDQQNIAVFTIHCLGQLRKRVCPTETNA